MKKLRPHVLAGLPEGRWGLQLLESTLADLSKVNLLFAIICSCATVSSYFIRDGFIEGLFRLEISRKQL